MSSCPSGAGHVVASGTVEHADKLVAKIASAIIVYQDRYAPNAFTNDFMDLAFFGGELGGEIDAGGFGLSMLVALCRELSLNGFELGRVHAPGLDVPAEPSPARQEYGPEREPHPKRYGH